MSVPFPEKRQFKWSPPSMCIQSVHGKDPINLLKAGQYFSKALAKLANPECKDGIILPASIYPPSWDKRDEILNKVINAAKLQANTTLTKQKTSTALDGMGEHHCYLKCFYCRLRCMDAKSNANTPVDSECAPGEIPSANY